jgi:hypothetical protein
MTDAERATVAEYALRRIRALEVDPGRLGYQKWFEQVRSITDDALTILILDAVTT